MFLPETIPACPPQLSQAAFHVALRELPVEQRREVISQVPQSDTDGLFAVTDGGGHLNACFVQRYPGNTAVFWPPQSTPSAMQLIAGAVAYIDKCQLRIVQVVLAEGGSPLQQPLAMYGFHHLADLQYLFWQVENALPAPTGELDFVAVGNNDESRFTHLLERTYEGTLDCPALDGVRPLDEVIDGYRATGVHVSDLWYFVQHDGRDVGTLVLTTHPAINDWELVYMGLVPAARGHGWGREIVRHAQQRAKVAGVRSLLLAVDSGNSPALKMYLARGFRPWDRRTILARFGPRADENRPQRAA